MIYINSMFINLKLMVCKRLCFYDRNLMMQLLVEIFKYLSINFVNCKMQIRETKRKVDGYYITLINKQLKHRKGCFVQL